jgi:ubiquinone/menaquinone biosynthesis C-methylase UbiE
VGPSGKIYSLDLHSIAIHAVKKIAKRKGFENIFTIESDCHIGLPDNSVDTFMLYDILHDLVHPDDVLRERHRLLKADRTLSFSGHHMKDEEGHIRVTGAGIFRLIRKGMKTCNFT